MCHAHVQRSEREREKKSIFYFVYTLTRTRMGWEKVTFDRTLQGGGGGVDVRYDAECCNIRYVQEGPVQWKAEEGSGGQPVVNYRLNLFWIGSYSCSLKKGYPLPPPPQTKKMCRVFSHFLNRKISQGNRKPFRATSRAFLNAANVRETFCHWGSETGSRCERCRTFANGVLE